MFYVLNLLGIGKGDISRTTPFFYSGSLLILSVRSVSHFSHFSNKIDLYKPKRRREKTYLGMENHM